jgi:SAM-dependent methyltransferase
MTTISVPAEYYDQLDSDNVCYLCSNPRYTLLHEVKHFDFPFTFRRCGCGLIKQTPMPNIQFFDWFFNADVFFSAKKTGKNHIWGYDDYFKDEPNRLATSLWRYRRLSHLFNSFGRPLSIMKIGPATGTFLHVAQQHGHTVLGCDVSQQFKAYAEEHYHVQIDHGRFEKQPYVDGQFDVVMLLNVIENVPNQVEFLNAIHRTLKPGGYFILNYVDMQNNWMERLQASRYFLYRPPVCYAYAKPVMEQILAKFGFAVRETFQDIRTLNIQKILGLLGWRQFEPVANALKLSRIPIRLYAYPSRIVVSQRL